MENNINQEENGVSLGDIFHWIGRGKIVGLISSVVVTFIVVIALFAIINPKEKHYEVEFDYSSIPGIGSGNGYYIDGTKFSYSDIIVEDSVNEVIANNKAEVEAKTAKYDYSSIDLDKLYGSNEFTIDIKRIYYDNVTSSKDEVPELKATHHVITLPRNAFGNYAVAKQFAKDLIELPLKKTKEMMIKLDYTTNLKMYNQVQSFDTKLAYLTSQVNLLLSGYSSFNGAVNGTQYIIDGKTYNFKALSAELSDFLANVNFETIEMELRQFGYVNDKDLARQRYALQMDDLKKQHDYLVKQRDSVQKTFDDAKEALKDVSSSTNVVTTDQIMALLTQVNETFLNKITDLNSQIISNEEEQRKLNIKIEAIDKLTDEDQKLIADRLDAVYGELVDQTDTYTTLYKTITTRNMNVYYTNSNVITTVGGLKSTILYGAPAASLLGVFIIVSWIYGYAKCKKEEQEAKA